MHKPNLTIGYLAYYSTDIIKLALSAQLGGGVATPGDQLIKGAIQAVTGHNHTLNSVTRCSRGWSVRDYHRASIAIKRFLNNATNVEPEDLAATVLEYTLALGDQAKHYSFLEDVCAPLEPDFNNVTQLAETVTDSD
jgi:hypothetical protein